MGGCGLQIRNWWTDFAPERLIGFSFLERRWSINPLCIKIVIDIKSQTAEDITAQFQAWGEPAYRVSQVLEWLYVHRVTSWDAMTNLPKALRERLKGQYTLQTLELVRKQGSEDTTQKFLWRLSDHSLIESVLIPANPAL